MNYSLNSLNLDYISSKFNTYDTNQYKTEYQTVQKESQDIFSPMNPTNLDNINILELSSLNNNTNNTFYGIKVKKLKPNLTMNIYHNKNYDPNKKTLVLDLDETLVHSSTEKPFPNKKNIILNLKIKNKDYKIYVILRPYLEFFLKEMSAYYNLYIFTASMSQYSTALLNILDKNRLIIKTFNREHCHYKYGLYFKDLSIFNVGYKNIIIIDNNPVSYALNKTNGIPIQTWIDDPNDKELIRLIPLLKYLSKVDDVRIVIKKIINRAKAKVNFTLFNELLRDSSKNNVKQKEEMINNMQTQKSTTKLKKKINMNPDVKNNINKINLFPKRKKINLQKKTNTEKNNNTNNKILIIDNNNNNINNEHTSKKLKIKKYIKDKIPEDKIKTKETNTKPNIFNISIENINNIQNNIKIVLKDKNKIIVSKLDKPKQTIKKVNAFKPDKIKSINIAKTGTNFETNDHNIINSEQLQAQIEDNSKSLILKNPLSYLDNHDKKPLDKDEDKDKKKLKKHFTLYKYFSNRETLNLQDENLIKTNVFFNNSLRINKRKNNYLNHAKPYKSASKGKMIVMKIIKTRSHRSEILIKNNDFE